MRIMGLKLALVAVALLLTAAAVWWAVGGTEVRREEKAALEITPLQVESIRSIGQWEFLSVSDEELVDTIRHGFFGDDELARVYYGTLRLGVDLADAGEGWVRMDGDTVRVTLPRVKLLDDDFIDEARTRSFAEEGKWTDADRAALTLKAVAAMRRRCLTKENLARAEANAKEQFASVVRAMGFPHVSVGF